MQSQADADRMISLGAAKDKVKMTGNLKYDAALMKTPAGGTEDLRKKLGLAAGDKLLIAGSTNPGEEEKVLRSYKELSMEFPGLRLLIAPRHVNRCAIITEIIKEAGLLPRLASIPDDKPLGRDRVALLDEMGVLAKYYEAADIVFIGGSLIDKGGQNPLEAAYYSKPILFGPYMHNFEGIASNLIAAKAAVKAADEAALTRSLRILLKDGQECRRMGENARRVLESNAGAAKKDLAFIEPLIKA
jgi:3-deoxy-D-manno-octulosonic-acid transferase